MMRGGILALLGLALLDPPVPGAGPRRRVYLVDASASVARPAGPDAFTPEDALRLAAHDAKSMRPDDRVALVAFGARPAVLVPLTPAGEARFPSRVEGIDRSSTDLAAALETAQALAAGGDIVLFSDGRSTSGPVPMERIHTPVHAFPLGPLGGVDATIRAIDAPASAPPGSKFTIRVTVESTGSWRGELIAGDARHPLEFSGAALQDVVFPAALPKGADKLEIALRLSSGAPDLCPENDAATVSIFSDDEPTRVQVINSSGRSGLAGIFTGQSWTSEVRPDLRSIAEADLVILERLRADDTPKADLERLARLVRDQGAGLVMLGGSASFALGGWGGTPVEEILPFWAFPDERSAVVVVLDTSGSMSEPAPGRTHSRFEEASTAIRRALELTHDDDELALVTFAGSAEVRCPLVSGRDRGRVAAALKSVSPGGPTAIAPALTLAASVVRSAKAGRRRVVLVTDGKSVDEGAALSQVLKELLDDGISGTLVRTGEGGTTTLEMLKRSWGEEIDGSDFAALDARVGEALARSRDLAGEPAAGLVFLGGLAYIPVNSSTRPARMNRASLKPGSEVLARIGEAPVAAIRPAGRGRVAATLVALEEGWAGNLAQWPGSVAFIAGLGQQVLPATGSRSTQVSLQFEGDVLHIRASLRGTERPDRIDALLNGEAVTLVRRGENTYSKTLGYSSNDAVLRIGGRVAGAARRLHPPEFDRVGPDEAALDRLTSATGGRRISAPRDLAALPRRSPPERRSARPLILTAALALFLLEIAASLLPK